MKKAWYTVIHEDERIIAVNKASGVSAGAERWMENAPRLDRLLAEETAGRGTGGGPAKLYTVHRVDKDASGLVLFAKDADTGGKISLAVENRLVKRTCLAVVYGRPLWDEGKAACDLPLVPGGNKKHMTIIDRYRGKPSFTAFSLLYSAGNYSVVEAAPVTGRTHRIRAHLAALGHPVVCDELYGKPGGVYLSSFKKNWRGDRFEERPLLARLGLHAWKLALPAYGEDGKELCLEAPPARDIAALVNQMKQVIY